MLAEHNIRDLETTIWKLDGSIPDHPLSAIPVRWVLPREPEKNFVIKYLKGLPRQALLPVAVMPTPGLASRRLQFTFRTCN
jgi:hypothetical protein